MSSENSNKTVTLCSIANVPIKVHITYIIFVLAAILILMTAYGGIWALKVIQILIYLFIAVLIHELGHAFVALRLGHKVHDVTIYPMGGLATIEVPINRPRDISWISFGGPAANFILFFICIFFEDMTIDSLGMLSLVLGASNLLPIKSFDGGVILRCFLIRRLGDKQTETILFATSIFIVAIVGAVGLFMQSFLLCISAVFMLAYGVLLNDST